MKCTGGLGTSAADSHNSGRAIETLTPSCTRLSARFVFSGVIRFGVPSSSSAPQRPQFDSLSK
jgi:hypothetical protein